MKMKKFPMRTCIGCREVKSKRELIRIVRKPTGEIEIDPTGKASGRGAYLCTRSECLEEAFKKRRLSHALDTPITEADMERLKEQFKALIDAASIDKDSAVKK